MSAEQTKQGPLVGLKIIEFAGIGPAPMASMLLADMGAEVIRIDRLTPSGNGISRPVRFDLLARGRQSIALDLKQPAGINCALELIAQADGLIEGFRPGTMEKLGLGPDTCLGEYRRPRYQLHCTDRRLRRDWSRRRSPHSSIEPNW